jgi:hypothetical protein
VDIVNNYPHPEWIRIEANESEIYSVNGSGNEYAFSSCFVLVKGTEDKKLCCVVLGKINIESVKVVRKAEGISHAQSCNIVVPYRVEFNFCCRLCYVEIYG